MKILRSQQAAGSWQELTRGDRVKFPLIQQIHNLHQLYRHNGRMGQELRLTAQVGDFEIDQVILELGLDINVLPKQTWKWMGEPTLEWSKVQLRMANQQKVIPLGKLSKVMVDIMGVRVLVDFEVI